MKSLIDNLNKAFESRVRLGIMAALMVNDHMDFNTLKELLNVTDGNLASHLKALENLDYINMNKEFIGRKPNTQYAATALGRSSFSNYITALEELLREKK